MGREKRDGRNTVGYAEQTSLLVECLAVLYVLNDVTTGVTGEYNTACRALLVSRMIDSSSPTSRKGLSERGLSAVDLSRDGDGMVEGMCLSYGNTVSLLY